MEKLNEDKLNNKKAIPVSTPDKNIGVEIDNSIVNLLSSDSIENTIIDRSVLDSFRQATERREYLYKIYDDMGSDVVISSALELYADDATEYSSQGKVVWVESDNSQVSNMGNVILNSLKIDENAWSHIYALVKYGDLYLETFRRSETAEHRAGLKSIIKNYDKEKLNDSLKNKESILFEDLVINKYEDGDTLEDYIEAESNPACVFELTQRGKTVGFIRTPNSQPQDGKNSKYSSVSNLYNYNIDDVELYDATKFVHILLQDPSNRNPEHVRIFNSAHVKTKTNKEKEKILAELEFKVKRGKSALFDIFKIYRELKLLEDSLLLNRLTRSSFVRLIQVEVGEMGKPQVSTLLRRIKQYFEQKTSFQEGVGGGIKNYNTPEPIVNNIYLPTREGKGAITTSDLGGDIDVKQLTDIDYFTNLLFAGLKIPKQFMGFTDDAAGFSGGTSLIKISSRYAKTIKRIQNSYTQGIKTLLNILFIDRGLDAYVNNFSIKMVSPSTVEDAERAESVQTNTDIVSNILGILSDITDEKDRLSILNILLKEYLNIPDLISALEDIIEKYDIPEEKTPIRAEDEDEEDLISSTTSDIDSKLSNISPRQTRKVSSEDETEEDESLPNPKDIEVDFSSGSEE